MSRLPAFLAGGLVACCGAGVLTGCGAKPERANVAGARVVYSRDGRLWISSPGGAGRRVLAGSRRWTYFEPRWSPDGRFVVFSRERADRSPTDSTLPTTIVAHADGHDERVVSPPGGGQMPAWSPRGDTIALSTRDGIVLVSPDGSGLETLPLNGSCPLWSPDGRLLAYCAAGADGRSTQIGVAHSDGRDGRLLTHGDAQNVPGAWSPDGSRLAFSSDLRGDFDMYVMRKDGTDVRLVHRAPGSQIVAAWLPSGAIVYSDSPPGEGNPRWYSIRPDGSKLHALHGLDGAGDSLDWLSSPHDKIGGGTRRAATGARLIDVAGRRMYIDCKGSGSPAVIFDAGLGVSSSTWLEVQRRVARFTRACRYDRAGVGLSEPGARPRVSGRIVVELRALLQRAGVAPPLVLVGASFGGLNVQLYQAEHPADVAGLVLVDGLPPTFDRQVERLLGPDQRRERRRQLEENSEGIRFVDLLRSEHELLRHERRLTIPLVVLRHGLPFAGGRGFPVTAVEKLWRRLEIEIARRSVRGTVEVAKRSHHRIAESEPALVSDAVRKVVGTLGR